MFPKTGNENSLRMVSPLLGPYFHMYTNDCANIRILIEHRIGIKANICPGECLFNQLLYSLGHLKGRDGDRIYELRRQKFTPTLLPKYEFFYFPQELVSAIAPRT